MSSASVGARAKHGSTSRVVAQQPRVAAVIQAARKAGLLKEKSERIGGRVSAALVAQAKEQTGIQTDTDLIEFALANIALKDDFAEKFKALEGLVDPKLDLEF